MTSPSLTRRALLVCAAGAPVLASCTHFSERYRDADVDVLARQLGVCAATYAMVRGGVPQASVAIAGCEVAGAGSGVLQADSIFQAASLTKPLVAYGALQLIQEARLDLDAPASRYLPGGYVHRQNIFNFKAAPRTDLVPAAALKNISLRSLLRHSSGLPNWSNEPLAVDVTAGERWRYSGEGYVLLQRIIEAVTGMDLEAYIARHLFSPAGMISSSLRWQESFSDRAVNGNSAPMGFGQPRFDEAVAAASLYTTAGDYAKFLAAVLADNDILRRTVSESISTSDEPGLHWGLGWGIEHGAGGPYLWQWGNNPGFRAFAMISAASKDGFVILTNSDNGMPLAVPVARTVFPGERQAFKFHLVG
jgi:CubicO group peptidase (beta-lactamase class C family)